MDDFGGSRFEGIGNTVRKKRSQTSRRPRPDSQYFLESHDQSPLSTPPSDDVSKVSSDENASYDTNSSRKVFNLNQCVSRGSYTARSEGDYLQQKVKDDAGFDALHSNSSSGNGIEQGYSSVSNHKLPGGGLSDRSKPSLTAVDNLENDKKFKKVKLKVGGIIRTIQTKSDPQDTSGSGSSFKSAKLADVSRPRQKLILQDDSEEDHSPPDKNIGLQGVPWKEFARHGFGIGKEESSTGKVLGKVGEKSDPLRKSRRVPKRRVLDANFEEDEDEEIRYLERLKKSKVSIGYKDFEEESGKKQKALSKISKDVKGENLDDFGPQKLRKDGKRSKSERALEDTDYEDDEEILSDIEPEGRKKKKQSKDQSDSPSESRRELMLTSRQRALLSKDASSAGGANQIEFPNGLPPPAPRKQKEKLTEVEQQLKKTEAAQRRRMQNEKAARESEAEAIRKILGQDSSRKKKEDKIKKRQEELAQEKAANAQMLASSTVRWVMGPAGTIVTFPTDMGLPRIFDPKPCSYPPPREKCAGPFCSNPFKYRDSKSNLPLCSLQCYKAIHEKVLAETTC